MIINKIIHLDQKGEIVAKYQSVSSIAYYTWLKGFNFK